MQLRATDEEKRDIGGSFADALSYLDDASPFVKLLNFLGPWAGVIDGMANAIYDRIVYVAAHTRGRSPAPGRYDGPPIATTTPMPAGNGRAYMTEDKDDTIYAPDPGKVAGY